MGLPPPWTRTGGRPTVAMKATPRSVARRAPASSIALPPRLIVVSWSPKVHMKIALSLLAGLAIVFALTLTVAAADKEKKEVTITGTITCAKCDLKETEKCATVIKGKAKDSDKEAIYYFDEKNGKANHKAIC